MGITLVESEDKLADALTAAFEFDDEVLCEQYIPLGRELRVGVLQQADGTLRFLPAIDYHLPAEKPIRLSADKIGVDENGVPANFTAASRTCPAILDSKLAAELEFGAKAAHTALGCRDFSLYDVRVDPAGKPFFLEASCYCSFAPRSVIVMMAAALDDPTVAHLPLFESLLQRAALRKQRPADGTQTLGMKQRPGACVTSHEGGSSSEEY